MAAAAGDTGGPVVQRRTVSKTPSLVLKPLSDCKDLPLLQRRASKGLAAGFIDADAAAVSSRLSNYRYEIVQDSGRDYPR